VSNNRAILACAALVAPPLVQLFAVALWKSAFPSSSGFGLFAVVVGGLVGSWILTRLWPRRAALVFVVSCPIYIACLWVLSLYFVGYVYGDWL
jgi:hypothetical protein